jgi:hypothetical protein
MTKIFSQCSILMFALVAGGVVLSLWAQEPLDLKRSGSASASGLVSDWTHRHLVFSESYANIDPNVSREIQNEPRYWLQKARRNRTLLTGSWSQDAQSDLPESTTDAMNRKRHGIRRDWSQTFQTGGTVYTLSSPTYPAKFSFTSSTPNCTSDYVVFTLPTGSSTFPGNFNVIAFNNLYVSTAGGASFCPGTAPQAIFEYNASSAGGAMNGSPALSLDGTLIAFVENATASNGGAVFHVLKWHSGDTQTVDTKFPNAFNNAALANCAANGAVAPCQYSLQYTPSGSRQTATLSSPFVDYSRDVAYVSDDGGNVSAISPVFGATAANPPALVAGWPINVGSSSILTPPVYDPVSKNVFVSSSSGTEYFVKTSGSTVGLCSAGSPPCLGANTFTFGGIGAIQEGSIVDPTTGRVFVFGTQLGLPSGSYVIQTDTALSASSVRTSQIGVGTLNNVFTGTFDNNYFTSVSSGKLYACGQNISGEGQLYAFGFDAAGVMSTTAVAGSPFALGNSPLANAHCTAGLSENFNQSTSKDGLFLGVSMRCVNTIAGTNGCVLSFDITSAFPAAVAHQLGVVGGTSGIVVDNGVDASTTKLTTDVYFILQGGQSCLDYLGSSHTGTCAVSATQSGLQ